MSSASSIAELLRGHTWVALTGAGLSTDSGIPDYRGPDAPPANPMLYQEFMSSAENRRRYWARSMQGFRSFGVARPNAGHFALAALAQAPGADLQGIITQNVDGLHDAAGSPDVLELHGAISRVICMNCGELTSRSDLQVRLEELNPDVEGTIPAGEAELRSGASKLRPDGDAEVEDWHDFVVADCATCGGLLKPDVVFFGESAARPIVKRAFEMVDASDVLVVAGSSLTVMSGLRFVRHQAKHGRKVVIVNRGATRGDEFADLRLESGTSETLSDLAHLLGHRR
ncbi:MAG: Sir2 family NAD-dependent protein deacetylase [Dermatophilus congolensis]|nr:Sir2 family NAD-dependent protein deacetylase [Dermatophilus congolensis]